MDPGYSEVNRRKIEHNAALLNVPITIFETDIFNVANGTDPHPATSAHACAAAICTAERRSWAATKSRWGIISTTLLKRRLWRCFTAYSFSDAAQAA
ncbi:MAG: hypothetical protein V8Q79_06715 [Christensenellales bacterium]